jgi:TRAP transporter TAXI family solute receptor
MRASKARRWLGVLVAGACLASVACRSGSAPPPKIPLKFAFLPNTAPGSRKIWSIVGTRLSTISIIDTTASMPDALDALDEGTVDLALLGGDEVYSAYLKGTPAKPVAHKHLRGVALLHTAALHVLVLPQSHIGALGDLRGKRLAGPQLGRESILALLLTQAGLTLSDIHIAHVLRTAAVTALTSGTIDAYFDFYPVVNDAFSTELRAGTLQLVPVAPQDTTSARRQYPYLHSDIIPSDAYGQANDIPTVGINYVFVCREGLDKDLVYQLTRAFFDVMPQLVELRPGLRTVSLKSASAAPIPLHPGAARFYRERQLFD